MEPEVELVLAGDVMVGRGIDQILAHPGDPTLHESYLQSALEYVELAEAVNGPIPRRVAPDYLWGDALVELARQPQALRIVNLETSVTRSDDWQPKGINYRMNPENGAVLTAARIDAVILANNHLLDWGEAGLLETLALLRALGIPYTGAGVEREEAARPVSLPLDGGQRLLLFAWGLPSSGIPEEWAAGAGRPGVNFLPDLSGDSLARVVSTIEKARTPGDLVVVSLHWGGNWGYFIDGATRAFAHGLVDAGVDLVHGHSSHHPKGIEIYHDRAILYGCGDLLNDYEGIAGYEAFRPGLVLLYFVRIQRNSGRLAGLRLVPLRLHRFRLERADRADGEWLREMLNREGRGFGTEFRLGEDGALHGV